MSTRSASDTQTHECGYCGGPRDPAASVNGSFCSEACLHRHRGAKALRQIASDHRRCATCFRLVKEVERPPDSDYSEVPECVIGFQYRTPHAVTGVDDFSDADAYRPLLGTRTSCECGAVNPADRHEVLRDVDLEGTVVALWQCLVECERDGTLQARPDRVEFFKALREEWRDWEYAVGRALYA